MIAFFDTCIHVDLLRGEITLDDLRPHAPGPIRLSPIVGSELLRGARERLRPTIEQLIHRMTPVEPPSWREALLTAGRLLPNVFPDHEGVGLANQQNDLLLALTARLTGTRIVTRDRHFEAIRHHVAFDCVVLP